MSAQHTPWSDGPWFVEEMDTRKRQYRVRCQNGIATGGAGMVVAERIELEHDARLIAAAPELFEALAGMVDGDSTTDIDERYENARAALAKATGVA